MTSYAFLGPPRTSQDLPGPPRTLVSLQNPRETPRKTQTNSRKSQEILGVPGLHSAYFSPVRASPATAQGLLRAWGLGVGPLHRRGARSVRLHRRYFRPHWPEIGAIRSLEFLGFPRILLGLSQDSTRKMGLPRPS